MTRPICLVDVDGVLNALRKDRKGRQRKAQVGIYTFRIPEGIEGRIASLERHFDMVWCTTWWNDIATEIVPLFGFGHGWPVVPFPWVTGTNRSGDKVPYVDAWSAANASDRPVCWIDDDPGPGAGRWATARSVPTKLITPDDGAGLTDDHVAEAVGWAARLGSGSAADLVTPSVRDLIEANHVIAMAAGEDHGFACALHDDAPLSGAATVCSQCGDKPLGRLEERLDDVDRGFWGTGDVAHAVAALAFGISMEQSFWEANKRTSLFAAHAALVANGYGPAIEVDDVEFARHLLGHWTGSHTLDDTIDLIRGRLASLTPIVVVRRSPHEAWSYGRTRDRFKDRGIPPVTPAEIDAWMGRQRAALDILR